MAVGAHGSYPRANLVDVDIDYIVFGRSGVEARA